MSCTQLVSPNLSTAGNVGYCLAFVEAAYTTPHGLYLYATQAWEATQYKHTDQNFPDGMYVPIWFSYMINGIDEGHVAIHMPDGRVLSSPWQSGTTQAILPNISELERIYSNNGQHPLTYLGWSEDISGKHVVEYLPDAPPYTLSPITPKQIQLKTDTHRWNVTIPDLPTILERPISSALKGEIILVNQLCTHIDGITYLIPADGDLSGYDRDDCEDYIPPPPKIYAAPSVAVTAKAAQTYKLLTTLPTYASAPDAMANSNGGAPLPPGTYYVWGTDGKALQLGIDNIHDPTGNWVNTLYNKIPDAVIVPPSVPEDPNAWKDTLTLFPDGKSRTYKSLGNWHIIDYAGVDTNGIDITETEPVPIFGSFKKGDLTYLYPRLAVDTSHERFYGIPTTNVYSGLPNMKGEAYTNSLAQAEEENRVYRKSVHHETTEDRLYYAQQLIARAVGDGVRFISEVIPLNRLRKLYGPKDKTKQ